MKKTFKQLLNNQSYRLSAINLDFNKTVEQHLNKKQISVKEYKDVVGFIKGLRRLKMLKDSDNTKLHIEDLGE